MSRTYEGVSVGIENAQGSKTTPSYVGFAKNGERLIGMAAKTQAYLNPENTVFDAKRLIGRKFNDHDVQKDMATWPFKVVQNESGDPVIEVTFKSKTCRFQVHFSLSLSLPLLGVVLRAYTHT